MISKILITGGCGYIGSRVASRLIKEGLEVTVADKVTPKARKIIFPPDIKIVIGDSRDPDFTKKATKRKGAEILQENSAIDAILYPNLISNKVSNIIYSSSSMVHQRSSVYPYKEDNINSINPPTNVYGKGEDSKGSAPGDIHVIPALVDKVIIGNPNATRPFTYIDDAVEATVSFVKESIKKGNKKVLNEDFNIGPQHAIKITDLAKIVWKISKDKRPFKYKLVSTNAITAGQREMDPSKTERVTGWKPKVSFEEGIKEVFDWLRSR